MVYTGDQLGRLLHWPWQMMVGARLEWWQCGGQCMNGTGGQKKNHHLEGAQLYDEASIRCFLSRKDLLVIQSHAFVFHQ